MGEIIKFDYSKSLDFISKEEINNLALEAKKCNKELSNGNGKGNDFLGWTNLPSSISPTLVKDIKHTANKFRKECEAVVIIGIGGSFLGAKSVIDALSNSFDWLDTDRKNPIMLFAGNNIGEDYIYEILEVLKNKTFGIINISKSGTTTEPALTFRILKENLESKIGAEEAKKLIVAITDAERGALFTLASNEGYKKYVIPNNVGGRYSVLTPVGLLPLAVAGIDIDALIDGAKLMENQTSPEISFENNIAEQYAVVRNLLYRSGKKIEILANYHPKLHYFAEWWKQLFGESEGKEHKGIFPAAVDFTADLHSMGQWIQEGERTIFETVIQIESTNHTYIIPKAEDNLDGLNYLAGKRIDFVNKMAALGTQIAHVDGGVPNLLVTISKLDAFNLGQLIYFFERSCGISGYILGVNPFDQPGVEAYKSNMFALLEKPGYEKATEEMKKRI